MKSFSYFHKLLNSRSKHAAKSTKIKYYAVLVPHLMIVYFPVLYFRCQKHIKLESCTAEVVSLPKRKCTTMVTIATLALPLRKGLGESHCSSSTTFQNFFNIVFIWQKLRLFSSLICMHNMTFNNVNVGSLYFSFP